MTTEQLEIELDQPISTGISFAQMLPWIMYSVAALFYCYAFFLRISPSMMVSEVSEHFHLTASQYGMMTSLYYLAYTPMQLPIGIIVDRFGARMVLTIAALISVSGVLVFTSTESLHMACVGRFLMGFGAAFAYITALKIASIWLPANRFAFAAGLTTAFGMIAGIVTDNYLAGIVQEVGFKQAYNASVVVGLILAGVFFTILRNHPKVTEKNAHLQEERPQFSELLQGIKTIFSSPQTWIIGLIGCLLYLPSSVFLDAYAPQYFKLAYGMNPHQAAKMVSLVFLGWIVGGPMIGAISDHIKLRRAPLLISSVLSTIVLMVIFYVPGLPIPMLSGLMFFLGVCCGSHPLVFALAKENTDKRLSGTATATANFLIMSGGLIWQPGVGFLIDHHSTGALLDGIRVYTMADYTYALAIIPIGLVVAIVLSVMLKETHCKPVNPSK
jgi:MFS family permease